MILLPEGLAAKLREILKSLGDTSRWEGVSMVSGGSINHAAQLNTLQRSYFLKWNGDPLPNMFSIEAESLAYLASKRVVNVPEVFAWEEKTQQTPAFILMEWVAENDSRPSSLQQQILGEQLACLHQISSSEYDEKFGLWFDNYIGSNRQINAWNTDWITFFREARLIPQLDLAERNGRMDHSRRKKLERLISKLHVYINPGSLRPSLLHGDLWGGNVVSGRNNQPYLIDPAIYFGDREADLAFTELFGGFSPGFYRAYQEVWPLESGYSDRKNLYNLYHLLNHLNLFGESYGSAVDSILNKYS